MRQRRIPGCQLHRGICSLGHEAGVQFLQKLQWCPACPAAPHSPVTLKTVSMSVQLLSSPQPSLPSPAVLPVACVPLLTQVPSVMMLLKLPSLPQGSPNAPQRGSTELTAGGAPLDGTPSPTTDPAALSPPSAAWPSSRKDTVRRGPAARRAAELTVPAGKGDSIGCFCVSASLLASIGVELVLTCPISANDGSQQATACSVLGSQEALSLPLAAQRGDGLRSLPCCCLALSLSKQAQLSSAVAASGPCISCSCRSLRCCCVSLQLDAQPDASATSLQRCSDSSAVKCLPCGVAGALQLLLRVKKCDSWLLGPRLKLTRNSLSRELSTSCQVPSRAQQEHGRQAGQ